MLVLHLWRAARHPIIFLAVVLPCLSSMGHGVHSVARLPSSRHSDPVEITDMGSVIAVRREFPLDPDACAASYDSDRGSCLVRFLSDPRTHLDHSFPIAPINLPGDHEISFQSEERGYSISYWGPAETKAAQLHQVRLALKQLAAQGVRDMAVHLYRPSGTKLSAYPFKEIRLGKIVGVRRKIPIRALDCQNTLSGNSCWVKVVSDESPDHPGPAGGEDVVEVEHQFSALERVHVRLDNYYNDYVIEYEGPQTDSATVMGRIAQAIRILKGSAEELYLECMMFTTESTGGGFGKFLDTKISDAVYFAVGLPLSYERCEQSFDALARHCRADFSALPAHLLDHPGGEENESVSVASDGSIHVLGTYAPENTFWRISYELSPMTPLSPLALIKKGLESLAQSGKTSIRAYGFRAD